MLYFVIWLHFLMCCCFSFSFSKHVLDDFCLSLVFKTVLNSVTFSNCGRFWKCAKQKIMYGSSSSHTQKGSMFFRPSPPDISYWDFLIANSKKWLTGLVWKDGGGGGGVVCVCVCVCFGGRGGGLVRGLINCPKVLMWATCSKVAFHLSYHTVTVPRFTTVVYCLFRLGEIVCWFS